MDKFEALKILEASEKRAFEELAQTSPKTQEYNFILQNIGMCRQVAEMMRYAEDVYADPDGVPAPAEAKVVMDETAATSAPTDGPNKEYVVAVLSSLGNKGVDIPAVFNAMGYDKLSDVPESRYAELVQRAQAAGGE